MSMALVFCFRLHRRKSLQNAAGIHRPLGLALETQSAQLLLELRQFPNTFIHMGNVLVKDGIDNVLLTFEESLLIFNHVASSIRFIKSIEARTKHATAPITIAAPDDDLPF